MNSLHLGGFCWTICNFKEKFREEYYSRVSSWAILKWTVSTYSKPCIPILLQHASILAWKTWSSVKNAKSLICCNWYSVIETILISLNFLFSSAYKNDWSRFNCFFAIQSVLSMNINSPVRKLLVSINQSFSGYLMLSTCQILSLQIIW